MCCSPLFKPELGSKSFLSCVVFCSFSAILTTLPALVTLPTYHPSSPMYCAHTFQSRALAGRRRRRRRFPDGRVLLSFQQLPPSLPSHHHSLLNPNIQPILYTSTFSIPLSKSISKHSLFLPCKGPFKLIAQDMNILVRNSLSKVIFCSDQNLHLLDVRSM